MTVLQEPVTHYHTWNCTSCKFYFGPEGRKQQRSDKRESTSFGQPALQPLNLSTNTCTGNINQQPQPSTSNMNACQQQPWTNEFRTMNYNDTTFTNTDLNSFLGFGDYDSSANNTDAGLTMFPPVEQIPEAGQHSAQRSKQNSSSNADAPGSPDLAMTLAG